MARKRANLADLLNDLTFRVIYDKFRLISMNAFEWEGLPEGILPRHIERNLFEYGKAGFFRAAGMGFMVLQAQDAGQYNVYHEPLRYIMTGYGYNESVAADNCVIIENNLLRLATRDFVLFYVNKLAEAERTMDVNVKSNKTPVIVLCDDKDVLSFKRIFQQVDGNVPAVFADKSLNLDNLSALDLKVKFLCNDLMDYKKDVENELLTFLGINNAGVDKRERLITDEANANNELIASFLDLQLEARQRACEEIRKKYGIQITVRRRQEPVDISVEGGERNDSKTPTV